MSEEKFSGVDTLIERMGTHPEEFFESSEKRGRWAFMYKDYFKDCMTESEKGRIHEALKKVRRLEFDALVVKELMKEEVVTEEQPEQKKVLTRKATGTLPVAAGGTGAITSSSLVHEVKEYQNQVRQLHQDFLKAQSNAVLEKKP